MSKESDNIEIKKNESSGALAYVCLLLIIVAVFLFSPGMSLLAIIVSIGGFKLDPTQMWTFAITTSAGIFGVMWYYGKSFKQYLLLSLVIIAVYLIAFYGFKADFPLIHWRYYFS